MADQLQDGMKNTTGAAIPPAARPHQGWHGEKDEISPLQVFTVILARRGTVARTTVVLGLLALIVALLTPKTYTASTSFIPQGLEGGMSSLAGLAGQFGFQLPTESPGASPEFYAALVQSRGILGILSEEQFSFESGEDSIVGTLPSLLEIGDEEDSDAVRRAETVKWLQGKGVAVSTSLRTGIIAVSVKTPWAGLSLALSQRMLELLNEFNLQTRQSQAAAEREFVEERLAVAQDSLRAAEDRFEEFLESNRQWSSSPELSFQHERLQREVTMRQVVFTSLAEAYEQARIAEVRNTPVITVVEVPELPVKADRRGRVMKLALGVVLGAVLGVVLALGQDYLQRPQRGEGVEYREFSALWEQTWKDVRTLGGVFPKSKNT